MISRIPNNWRNSIYVCKSKRTHKTVGKTHTRLGVGAHVLQVGLLLHHLSEVDITTDGVLVAVLSGVDTRGVGGVALEGLEGIEVG